MKEYISFLNDNYRVRKSEKQKEEFREYITKEVETMGLAANVETLDKKHNNVIVGNIKEAKVIFTAHYDTPAASLIPNLMIPRKPWLCYSYSILFFVLLAIIALGLSYLGSYLFNYGYPVVILIYLLLYFGFFYVGFKAFPNKNNYNDNTSGVSVILSLIEKNKDRNDIAYVLFDNEEKGTLGSKAFAKKYQEELKNKLVINFDCVGNGNEFLIVSKKEAEELEEHKRLLSIPFKNEEYNMTYFPKKGSISNTDYKNFSCGVTVFACKKSKFFGYITTKIHTRFDRVVSNENITILAEYFTDFINLL